MKADALCRTCRAPVRWVRVLPDLKRMPVNSAPVADGNMWVDHWEGGTPIMAVALNHDGVPRSEPLSYVSHFATCKDAKTWRKK